MEKHRHNTAQHAAIVKYLKKNKHHPNIIDIYKNVSKKLSTISMTTVYNTVDLLRKEGIIQELAMRHHEGRRFDSNHQGFGGVAVLVRWLAGWRAAES